MSQGTSLRQRRPCYGNENQGVDDNEYIAKSNDRMCRRGFDLSDGLCIWRVPDTAGDNGAVFSH